jgi:hypothetical protein
MREEGIELVAAEAVEGDADDEPALERKQRGGLELGLELGRAGQDEAEQRLGRRVELDEAAQLGERGDRQAVGLIDPEHGPDGPVLDDVYERLGGLDARAARRDAQDLGDVAHDAEQ